MLLDLKNNFEKLSNLLFFVWYFRRCWEYLVWLDPANYGGVLGKAPQDLEESNQSAERENNGEDSDENDESEVMYFLKRGFYFFIYLMLILFNKLFLLFIYYVYRVSEKFINNY